MFCACMERKEGSNSLGFTLKTDEEAPRDHTARFKDLFGQTPPPPPAVEAPPLPVRAPPLPVMAPPPSTQAKKRRGRPRKYPVNGNSLQFSPAPMSAPASLPNGYPQVFQPVQLTPVHLPGIGSAGDMSQMVASYSVRMLTVNAGEDIMMKIMNFSQKESKGISIMSANGRVSTITLLDPRSAGSTLTYEGSFNILSLVGTFISSDNGLSRSRTGAMSLTFSDLNSEARGGVIAGMLVAESPVQLTIACFPTEQQLQEEEEQRQEMAAKKKSIYEVGIPMPEGRYEPSSYNGPSPYLGAAAPSRGDIASTSSMRANPGNGGY